MSELIQLGTYIDPDYKRQLKMQALVESKSLTDLINDTLMKVYPREQTHSEILEELVEATTEGKK